jgi:hypothetical protein
MKPSQSWNSRGPTQEVEAPVHYKSTSPNARASVKSREEASRRFEDTSRAYYLLIHSGCCPQRLEQAAAAMDRWAQRLS